MILELSGKGQFRIREEINMNLNVTMTVEEIKQTLLNILIQFDHMCKKYNLKYSLAYGTLIGAARHSGFIPWDDDIDVVMPQDDYLKLISIEEVKNPHQRYSLHMGECEKKYGEHYVYPFAKLEDNYTKMIYHHSKDTGGAFIDIFPVTGLPCDMNERKKYISKMLKLQAIIGVGDYCSDKIASNLKSLFYFSGYRFIRNRMIKNAFQFDYFNCDYVAQSIWSFGEREIFKNDLFENLIDISFEGYNFKAFANYDEILKQLYGDWRKLPPQEQRISHHDYDLVLL